jgi:hypothetical protein
VNSFRIATAVLVAVTVVGCFRSALPAGWRQLIVTVENQSAQPATLLVAEDGPVMGPPVGTADPGVVPAGVTMDVVFGIPPGAQWAIFVNPVPERGALLGAADVDENAVGRQPFTILIGESGSPSWGIRPY